MPIDELTDEESTLFLKVVRNNTRNNVKRLTIRNDEVVISFSDGISDPASIPKKEAMAWKDKDWQKFFEKHEPLM